MQIVAPNLQSPVSDIKSLLQQTHIRLTPHTDTPSLDAQVLLAHIISKPRTWLLAHPEASLTAEQTSQLELELQKLESGIPLPYVLGEWEFFGLKFKVTPGVLIPRPETELLVEIALDWLNKDSTLSGATEDCKSKGAICVADIGTGSGCIAVTLAVQCPNLHLLATDISPSALAVAQHNAEIHQVSDRVTFLRADLLNLQSPISNLQLITANLPYIPTTTLHSLDVYGREPTLALDGGPDGLTLIKRLLSQAATVLAPGGLILLEIEASQGISASNLAHKYFPEADIHIKQDLAGHDRLLSIQT